MKLKDYNEYYIQNSGHYLIPKALFIELYEEMANFREETIELKSQLKGHIHCFDEEEHNRLQKENKKYKEVFDKINVFLDNHDKNAGKLYYKYDNKYLLSEIKEDIRDILKEVK